MISIYHIMNDERLIKENVVLLSTHSVCFLRILYFHAYTVLFTSRHFVLKIKKMKAKTRIKRNCVKLLSLVRGNFNERKLCVRSVCIIEENLKMINSRQNSATRAGKS